MENQYKVHQLIRLNGNPIFAGIYKESELPDAVKSNPLLCSKLDESTPKTANYQDAIKTQNITVGTKKPAQGLESFAPKAAVNLDLKAEKPEVVLLNLKDATLDNLSALEGITISTAQSVIEQRTKKAFVNFEDLDKRVPLKGSRKWSSFSDRLKI